MPRTSVKDRPYFAQRASAEWALAREALSPAARQAHRRFAERYDALAVGEDRDTALMSGRADGAPTKS